MNKTWMPTIILLLLAAACLPKTNTPVPPELTPTFANQPGVLPTPAPAQAAETPTSTLGPFMQPTCAWCALQTATAQSSKPSQTPESNRATVNKEKLDVWDDPAQENSYWHRQTQLILGEPVVILEVNGDWARIIAVEQPSSKNPRGYPGWVRKLGLAPGWVVTGPFLVVHARSTTALAEPSEKSRVLNRLYLDARLPLVSEAGDWLQAELPGGQKAWVIRKDAWIAAERSSRRPVKFDFSTAWFTFEGAPYLWGGTIPDNFDCSGFTYRLFHSIGIILPRDANDQALVGQPVRLEQVQAGDLIFFTDVSTGPVTHVAMALNKEYVVDAEPTGGLQKRKLSDVVKNYVFHSIRRILVN